MIVDEFGQYSVTSNEPGSERSQGWGPDPYGHWHYGNSLISLPVTLHTQSSIQFLRDEIHIWHLRMELSHSTL